MNRTIHICILGLCILSVLFLAGCTPDSKTGGPASWIDKPHNGSSFDMQNIQVIAHSNDPGGLAQVEISVNGQVVDKQPASGTFAQISTSWTPAKAGNYAVRVRGQNAAGAWGEYAEANIKVGVETPTTIPSDTPTPTTTATPTLTATLTTPTITPTPAKAGALSFKINVSSKQFYNGSCGVNQVVLQAYPENGEKVKAITLFLNLQDQAGSGSTGWNEGDLMTAVGDGWFQRVVHAGDLEGRNKYQNAWLLYQFVATDASNAIIGRSPVKSDIQLISCGSAPAEGITPVRPAVPNPVRVNTLKAPINVLP